MAFNTLETGAETGQPIELYLFNLGSQSHAWTTNPVPYTYNSVEYQPTEVERQELAFSSDERAEALLIKIPASNPLVRQYINSVPGQRATLSLFRLHRNDGANEVVQFFKGSAQTVGFSQNGLTAEIAVLPITADLANSIPRFVFSQVCNNVLFDEGCTVTPSLFRHLDTVTGVAGDQVTVNGLGAKGDDWAAGGYIATPTGDFRQILAHTGDVIRLLLPFGESPLGVTAEVYAGCDHSALTCETKFANLINIAGYPYSPTKNPFETGLNSA